MDRRRRRRRRMMMMMMMMQRSMRRGESRAGSIIYCSPLVDWSTVNVVLLAASVHCQPTCAAQDLWIRESQQQPPAQAVWGEGTEGTTSKFRRVMSSGSCLAIGTSCPDEIKKRYYMILIWYIMPNCIHIHTRCRISWNIMEYHGISWNIMEYHPMPYQVKRRKVGTFLLRLRVQVQQIRTKLKPCVAIRAYQSRLVSLYRTQYIMPNCIHIHTRCRISWNIMEYHGISWNIMEYHPMPYQVKRRKVGTLFWGCGFKYNKCEYQQNWNHDVWRLEHIRAG